MNPFLLVGLIVSGCAYVPRAVRLQAPEPGPPSPICIEVGQFTDTRVDKTRVGVARNGFFWPTGSAHTDDDVARWIGDHLRASLSPGACVPEFTLEGRVREVFVDAYFNLDARIVVTLRLERQRTVIFDRDFEATFSQLAHLGSSSEFEETLRRALAAFGDRVIPSIIAGAADAPRPTGL